MRTNLSAALPERIKTKKTYFCDFNADSPFPRVDYTERRKIMRKNVKCPRRRIHQFRSQGALPQRQEILTWGEGWSMYQLLVTSDFSLLNIYIYIYSIQGAGFKNEKVFSY